MSRVDFARAGQFWASGARPHPIGCDCGPDGYHCEIAQAVAEEADERREMAGRYPCGARAPHAAADCPGCRGAWGYDQEASW